METEMMYMWLLRSALLLSAPLSIGIGLLLLGVIYVNTNDKWSTFSIISFVLMILICALVVLFWVLGARVFLV